MGDEEQIQRLAEDDKTISDIAEEVGLSSEDGERMLKNAFDRMAVDESFEDEVFSVQESPYNYSLVEHIQSTLSVFMANRRYPSHGRVTDVDYEDETLSLDIETIGYSSSFTASFSFSPDNDEKPPKELAYLYDQANCTLYEPSSIVGKEIPVTYNDGYEVHYPPESPGIASLIHYRIIRMFRRLNMVKTKNGHNGLTNTGWGYFVILSLVMLLGFHISGLEIGLGFLIATSVIACLGYSKTFIFD